PSASASARVESSAQLRRRPKLKPVPRAIRIAMCIFLISCSDSYLLDPVEHFPRLRHKQYPLAFPVPPFVKFYLVRVQVTEVQSPASLFRNPRGECDFDARRLDSCHRVVLSNAAQMSAVSQHAAGIPRKLTPLL